MEAVVLAGGLGSRLSAIVSDRPKPMASVGGQPFLAYVLHRLQEQGVGRVVLSVGIKKQAIIDYFGTRWRGLVIDYATEDEPLGTGGAMLRSLSLLRTSPIFVLNGDTYVEIDLAAMWALHSSTQAALTLAVKWLPDTGRYGTVILEEGHVVEFRKKSVRPPGYVSVGTYLVNRNLFAGKSWPKAFSFEKKFLEARARSSRWSAFVTESAFLDIGLPEDYARAESMLEGKGPLQ